MFRPIDIARKIGVSTSALRHYEDWGIVPPVRRNEKGYRIYTELHVAYFECIRAMSPGFGMKLIRDIMPLIQRKEIAEALWMVSEVQAKLYNENKKVGKALELLEKDQMEEMEEKTPMKKKKRYSISEAADAIGVANSTLRHWEKEDLIVPERDPDSGYRLYSGSDLRKLLIIRTLQNAVYSLDIVREVLAEMDHHNISEAIKITRESLEYLDYLIKQQLRGMSYLYYLCEQVERESPA
ncbi:MULTISPECIES: MerR family transcriptional regulator [unclassified Sutcliffiella]|uniref:MerR family transcriptional regulator n=1 Tax=unclassified Sutcliffiella TaxID=2837532 RepID=UPI0030CE3CC6